MLHGEWHLYCNSPGVTITGCLGDIKSWGNYRWAYHSHKASLLRQCWSCFCVDGKIHSTSMQRTRLTELLKARSVNIMSRIWGNKGVVWPLHSLPGSSCFQVFEKLKAVEHIYGYIKKKLDHSNPDVCWLAVHSNCCIWHKHLAYNIQYNYKNREKERTDYCIEHLKRCFLSAPLYPACSLCKKSKENSKHDAMPYDAMQSDAKSVKVKESHTINLVFLRQISSHDSWSFPLSW